jgi:hypothetical protein
MRNFMIIVALLAAACGGKAAPAKTTTPVKAEPADPHDLSLQGEDTNRMCEWYASALEENPDDAPENPLEACHAEVDVLSPEERTQISDCMNSCGDSTGVVHCIQDFGTDSFPACAPEEIDEDEPVE